MNFIPQSTKSNIFGTRYIFIFLLFFSLISFIIPHAIASAHEVYVLRPDEVTKLLAVKSPDPFDAVKTNGGEFLLWTFITILTITSVFLISISRKIEAIFDPILFALKRKLGFIVIRVTIGLALIASGYYQSLFGPELPLFKIFGPYSMFISIALVVIGLCILFGFLTRVMGIAALFISLFGFYKYGVYMFTYSNYLGDIIFVAFLGAHVLSFDKHVFHWHGLLGTIERFVEKYAFLILRVTFGFSLIYASLYAKFFHSALALQTVIDYHLTTYFHFDPLFIVLGACIIEVLLGVFMIIGFEMRFTSLFLMVFLTMSLLYFGEVVWPHIVLFGGALALFIHGYDQYTIEGYFFKKAEREPVL